jgi:hypothetical protein
MVSIRYFFEVWEAFPKKETRLAAVMSVKAPVGAEGGCGAASFDFAPPGEASWANSGDDPHRRKQRAALLTRIRTKNFKIKPIS